MSLQKKRHLEQDQKQEGSVVKKKCSPLVSDCLKKVPVVKLHKLKLELDQQYRKQNVMKPEHGPRCSRGRQEQKPDDGSTHSKLPPSPFALNELLASDINTTNNPHHQQDTKEIQVCTSRPKECSKIPVDPRLCLKVQTEAQEEQTPTSESDRKHHHNQEPVPLPSDSEADDGVAVFLLAQNAIQLPNTDFPRKGDPVSKDCTSLETMCLKQPVVRLIRLNLKKQKQWQATDESDSEHHLHTVQCIQPEEQEEQSMDDNVEEPVTSPSNTEAHDGVALSPLAQNAVLPNTDFLRRLDQQESAPVSKDCTSLDTVRLKQPVVRLIRLNIEGKKQWQATDESDSEHHHDTVQCIQPEQQEEQCIDNKLDKQVTSPSNTDVLRHLDQQESAPVSNDCTSVNKGCASLENIRLKQPVVHLIRLNIETKNQCPATDESDSEHEPDDVQCMQSEKQKEQCIEESDSEDFDDQDLKTLSAYELKRLKNIKENAKFLKSLKLHKVSSTICQLQQRRQCVMRGKTKSGMSKRRSVRLLERKVLIKIPEKDDSDDSVVLGPKQLQIHGPIKMAPSNYVDHGAWISFQETWKSISTVKCVKPSSFKCKKITSYANKLQTLTLKEKAVKHTILGSISSIAIHPSETRTLVAAGDCNGNIGLWDLKRRSADIYVFPVHSRRTRIVAFSPSDPQYLLSLGYEGTIRCGDISYSVFDEIYHAEGYLTSFDFLSVDGSVLLASHYDSKLSVVDRRTRNKTSNVHGCLDSKFVYSVSVHPLQRDLCVVAGSSDVLVYDVRQLRKDTTQPVMSLLRHTSGVASASFSPATGNCILTSSMEPCLQVFRTENFGRNLNPFKTFRFNTAQRVRLIPVVWDPKQENCFVHGLMGGGEIDILHVKGRLVHTLSSTYLSAKPSVLAVHPTRHAVVAGTANGMLCLFKKWRDKIGST